MKNGFEWPHGHELSHRPVWPKGTTGVVWLTSNRNLPCRMIIVVWPSDLRNRCLYFPYSHVMALLRCAHHFAMVDPDQGEPVARTCICVQQKGIG